MITEELNRKMEREKNVYLGVFLFFCKRQVQLIRTAYLYVKHSQ